MRRKDREITNKAEIEAVLKKAFVCHLGLADGDQPYVVPMNYGYEDGHIYLHGAAEGRKIDTIRKNSKVCFEMETFQPEIVKGGDQPCDWGTAFRSVIGFGTARLLEDPEEKIRALSIIVKAHDDRDFTFPEAMLSLTAVIDVTISEMTGKMAND
jgi:nitroimidazol reductase NimA-like FMN-containing flavoprotein (pyridoxamine 5'-phosphate oxidase superfamily)